uniref:Ovule protein n=1 Tax=Romanomermis culicivorax TaxID=13658 RepID=A0A915KM44_ROMCU
FKHYRVLKIKQKFRCVALETYRKQKINKYQKIKLKKLSYLPIIFITRRLFQSNHKQSNLYNHPSV